MLGNCRLIISEGAIEWAWNSCKYIASKILKVQGLGVIMGDNSRIQMRLLLKNIVAEDRIIHGKKKDNFWEMARLTGDCVRNSH